MAGQSSLGPYLKYFDSEANVVIQVLINNNKNTFNVYLDNKDIVESPFEKIQ